MSILYGFHFYKVLRVGRQIGIRHRIARPRDTEIFNITMRYGLHDHILLQKGTCDSVYTDFIYKYNYEKYNSTQGEE